MEYDAERNHLLKNHENTVTNSPLIHADLNLINR